MNGIDLAACRRNLEVLPWYANGTLSSNERADVERHLQDCAACRNEAELLGALVRTMPAPANPPGGAAAFSQLLQRIGQQERRTRNWRAAAALLLAVLGATAVALPAYLLEPRYRTVTDSMPVAQERVQMEVVLDADAGPAVLAELMRRYDADVVSMGAGRNGIFLLEFRLPSGKETSALLDELRREPQVRMARLRGDAR